MLVFCDAAAIEPARLLHVDLHVGMCRVLLDSRSLNIALSPASLLPVGMCRLAIVVLSFDCFRRRVFRLLSAAAPVPFCSDDLGRSSFSILADAGFSFLCVY